MKIFAIHTLKMPPIKIEMLASFVENIDSELFEDSYIKPVEFQLG